MAGKKTVKLSLFDAGLDGGPPQDRNRRQPVRRGRLPARRGSRSSPTRRSDRHARRGDTPTSSAPAARAGRRPSRTALRVSRRRATSCAIDALDDPARRDACSCTARAAAARPRCSGCSPACCGPRGAACACSAPTSRRWAAARATRSARRHLGYVFQMFNLIPYLSVRENIVLPLPARRAQRRRASAATSPRRGRRATGRAARHRASCSTSP